MHLGDVRVSVSCQEICPTGTSNLQVRILCTYSRNTYYVIQSLVTVNESLLSRLCYKHTYTLTVIQPVPSGPRDVSYNTPLFISHLIRHFFPDDELLAAISSHRTVLLRGAGDPIMTLAHCWPINSCMVLCISSIPEVGAGTLCS